RRSSDLVHANSPRDALARIETMTLMAGLELPVRAIRDQMSSAVDLIVHLARLRDGSRHVTHVTEVHGMEGDIVTLQDVFLYDFGMGDEADGRSKGRLKATGIRPHLSEKVSDYGIELPAQLFQTEGFT